jgi:hypothetical protein
MASRPAVRNLHWIAFVTKDEPSCVSNCPLPDDTGPGGRGSLPDGLSPSWSRNGKAAFAFSKATLQKSADNRERFEYYAHVHSVAEASTSPANALSIISARASPLRQRLGIPSSPQHAPASCPQTAPVVSESSPRLTGSSVPVGKNSIPAPKASPKSEQCCQGCC